MAEWALRRASGRPGAAVPGRGVVGRRHPRDDGRRTASASGPRPQFHVRSKVRPWSGTMADVDRRRPFVRRPRWPQTASGPATSWCSSCPTGSRPGSRSGPPPTSVPSWCRSCTSTAPRRSTTSSTPPNPAVVITADRFGLTDHLAVWEGLLADRPGPRWLVVGDTPAASLPARATRVRGSPRRTRRSPSRVAVDPDAPALIAFTSGTTKDPKGVIHSHRTITCEARQLDLHVPEGRSAHHHRRAGGPLHRDAQRLRRAAAPRPPREHGRRVGSGRDPAPDARPRTSAWAAAPPSSSPASSTTPTSPTSTSPACPSPGSAGRRCPPPSPSGRRSSASRRSAPTGAPSTRRSPAR